MTVGILIDSWGLSGAEKRALKIASALDQQNGVTCYLITTRELFGKYAVPRYKNLIPRNVIIYNRYTWLNKFVRFLLPRTRYKNAYYQSLLNKRIKQKKIRLVHVFLERGLLSITSDKMPDLKVIFELTSPDVLNYTRERADIFLDKVDHFNAVSDRVYDRALGFIPAEKLSKAPIPFFYPVEHPVDQHSVLENKENTVLFAHRLAPRKNGFLFAQVARAFLKEYPNWKVKLFGTGEEEEKIRALLQDEIKEGRVIMKYTPHVLSELEKSRIFVSIIQPDNYPSQSVMEAMYTGNALLLSDMGYTKSRFFNNNGSMCEISFDAVLTSLKALANDPEQLRHMGKASIEHVNTAFPRSIYLNFLLQLYKQVM